MVGRAGRASGKNASSTRRSTRDSATSVRQIVPDVYQDMLVDAASSAATSAGEERPVKKRRVGGRMVLANRPEESQSQAEPAPEIRSAIDSPAPVTATAQQTAYTESEGSANSDMEWEEVDLKTTTKEIPSVGEDKETLDLILGGDEDSKNRRVTFRKKPITANERKLRLEIHKMNLLSLFVHVHFRNHWCNDPSIHELLRTHLSKRMIQYLNEDDDKSQFQRSRSFMDGLDQASEAFRTNFSINSRGMSRPYWATDTESLANKKIPVDAELPMQKLDFVEAAVKLEGSRDTGAQIFCALLRSAGVEARLVCSLQLLPFNATSQITAPQRARPLPMVARPDPSFATSDDESLGDTASDTSLRSRISNTSSATPNQIRSRLATRLGRPQPTDSASPIDEKILLNNNKRKKRIRESSYPVYWVEAFNAAVQKWIPIDPLVTKTVGKPTKFEPPASDPENNMFYVVSFEDDGSARDVTRRYVRAYNAKTRKGRVETVKGGERWLQRVMKIYKRSYSLDRDQVEEAELAKKEAAEEMPRNVQDFKDHPYYALERHVKRNEVIDPKREVGKVSAGNKNLEPIYRRRDVHIVKSADGWYRLGMEIKAGEQPLKRVQPRRRVDRELEDQVSDDEEQAGTGMYAAFQTKPYIAPPVVNGRIPKNTFGNFDIYVPSMVPKGGVHIKHIDTSRAARIIGIDYADAVTGFEFKGRHGTAIVKGAIVAVEYKEAIEEMILAFEYEREEAEEAMRTREALKTWKRFLAGLRIRERIGGYDVEGEGQDTNAESDEVEDETFADYEDGGGFLPDHDAEAAKPTAGQAFGRLSSHDIEESVYVPDQTLEGAQNMTDQDLEPNLDEQEDISFVHNEAAEHGIGSDYLDVAGGGFIPGDQGGQEKLTHHEHADVGRENYSERKGEPQPYDNAYPETELDGGGFLPDEPLGKNQIAEHASPQANNSKSNHDLAVPQHEEEATRLQQFHEQGSVSYPQETLAPRASRSVGPSEEKEETQERPAATQDNRLSDDEDMRDTSDKQSVEHINEPMASEQESEPDKGSLMSHDPSDDDADPEWLA